MSIYYRDKNGSRRVVAGMTPGGDLAMGANTTRSGSYTVPALAAGGAATVTVTFNEPMPDDDFCVTLDTGATSTLNVFNVRNKTANGFIVTVANNNTSSSQSSFTAYYKAFKLYEVSEAEQNASDITTLKSYVPATTSSSNKLVNANQLAAVDLEDLADVDVATPTDGQTLIWDDTNSKWVNGQGGKTYTAGDGIDIDANDKISTDPDLVPFTFVGTTAEWNALTTAQKKAYKICTLTDDDDYVGNIVDAVTDGEMSAVTSNAVYDATNNKTKKPLWGSTHTSMWQATSFTPTTADKYVSISLRGAGNIYVTVTIDDSTPFVGTIITDVNHAGCTPMFYVPMGHTISYTYDVSGYDYHFIIQDVE